MTGLEIAEERERDASRQRRHDERAAAALAAADEALAAQVEAEEGVVETAWATDTQLQLSQLLCFDTDLYKDQQGQSSSSEASVA
jgi:hypothetical protein